ncbi:MAG: hypothetical protein HC902_08725 [Calothrix sp. SM1_5_4]|nr:hypothetical protein [Calothrix sp. SM1_5_4]
MDFFEAVERRRSVRKFTSAPVPAELVERAVAAAVKAPNSSNTQTWGFHWVKAPEKKGRARGSMSIPVGRTHRRRIGRRDREPPGLETLSITTA